MTTIDLAAVAAEVHEPSRTGRADLEAIDAAGPPKPGTSPRELLIRAWLTARAPHGSTGRETAGSFTVKGVRREDLLRWVMRDLCRLRDAGLVSGGDAPGAPAWGSPDVPWFITDAGRVVDEASTTVTTDAELLARIDAEVSRSLDTHPLCLELAASTGRDRADMYREVTAQALALYLEAHTSRRLAEGDE